MADVVFKLDGDQAKAVNAFLRVVDAQKKSERQFKKTTSAARGQDKALGRAANTVGKLGKGLLALGGVGAAAGAFSKISQGIDEMARSSGRFERDIRPLLSLGGNFQDIEGIRKKVLSASGGLGRGSKEVADAFFALQSGASNLSDTIQKDLFTSASKLAFLQNGDLAGSVNLLTKFYQNYGKEVVSVTDLSNKLFAAADRGVLTLDELAKFGPDVAAAAKVMNISLNELLATLIVTTQQLGRNESTFTGVRNIILRMNNAQKEGIQLSELFTDKLQELSRVEPNLLKKIFGDEGLAVIAVASENAGAIADEVARLNLEAGKLSEKLQAIVKDHSQLTAINLASAMQVRENAAAGNLSPEVGKFALRKADIASGISNTPQGQLFPALTDFQASASTAAITLEEFVRSKGIDFGSSFITDSIRGFEDIGREKRLNAQQRSFPEAFKQNLLNSGEVRPGINLSGGGPRERLGDTSAFNDLISKLDRAADMQLRAAELQERAANAKQGNARGPLDLNVHRE